MSGWWIIPFAVLGLASWVALVLLIRWLILL